MYSSASGIDRDRDAKPLEPPDTADEIMHIGDAAIEHGREQCARVVRVPTGDRDPQLDVRAVAQVDRDLSTRVGDA